MAKKSTKKESSQKQSNSKSTKKKAKNSLMQSAGALESSAKPKRARDSYEKMNTITETWIENFHFESELPLANKNDRTTGFIYLMGEEDKNYVLSLIEAHALDWQREKLRVADKEVISFSGRLGPVWILKQKLNQEEAQHQGLLQDSKYSWCRDQMGQIVGVLKNHQIEQVGIELHGTSDEMDLGALVGLELAAYSFKGVQEKQDFKSLPQVYIRKSLAHFDRALIKSAQARAKAVNWARHLVNQPPNLLNPESFSQLVRKYKWSSTLKIEIWDTKKLQKEGMGLHLGVGQGSEHGPCLVHLKYRPKKRTSGSFAQAKPIAFVGKGITFDTGGLDIKPSSGMRLMKKDMGGAAALFGLATWLSDSDYPAPVDLYLGLAENSVDSKSFRPSDVCVARNGMAIEIHNTDAEGRLVLADCLDVAITQKGADAPELVVDIATLTGAIKVALGADLAGLFSNDDELAHQLSRASQASGDLSWRMPLFDRYNGQMSSHFADVTNAVDGFGGAITAALFLQKFVGNKKWAHLDIYAWADKAHGALTSAGGSGQGVQMLIEFLEARIS